MKGLFLINVLLVVAWGAVTGSFGTVNLLFGFVLSTVALLLIREQIGTIGYLRRARLATGLAALFLYELALSAVRVFAIVMRPDMNIKPAVFSYPLTVDRDFEITLLANLITLTPGTLSVDVSEDRNTLFVHVIDGVDVDATIADIRDGFERKIMETFR